MKKTPAELEMLIQEKYGKLHEIANRSEALLKAYKINDVLDYVGNLKLIENHAEIEEKLAPALEYERRLNEAEEKGEEFKKTIDKLMQSSVHSSSVQAEVYERIISNKDAEIAKLKQQLKTALGTGGDMASQYEAELDASIKDKALGANGFM